MSVRKFEAIKYALRQSKDGVIVSFVVHPNDVDDQLTCLPIGARVAIGWVALADDETEIAAPSPKPNGDAKKDRKRFEELNAAQQAGMLCDSALFQAFLANFMPKKWSLFKHTDLSVTAADCVRHACGVESRRDIPNNPVALERWLDVLSRYRQWETDNIYGDQAR